MPRFCTVPGCPNLTDRSQCAQHTRDADRQLKRRHRWRDYHTDSYQALRRRVITEEPRCRHCGAPTTEVDHITPRRRGGPTTRANLQGLCKPCHSTKTARENRLGGSP